MPNFLHASNCEDILLSDVSAFSPTIEISDTPTSEKREQGTQTFTINNDKFKTPTTTSKMDNNEIYVFIKRSAIANETIAKELNLLNAKRFC